MKLATVVVPGKGLTVAKLNTGWLDYAIGVTWSAHWQRTKLPSLTIGKVLDFPAEVSLAATAKGEIYATVLYKRGTIIVAELTRHPDWQAITPTPWS